VSKLHRFRDMATYWSKIAYKTYPLIWHVPWRWPIANFRRVIPCHKLKSWGYQMVYISRSCVHSARHNTGCDRRTDGQTDRRTRRCRKDRTIHSVARVNKKAVLSQRWPRNAPHIWVPSKFSELPASRTLLVFPKFFMGFCSDWPCKCAYKI